VSATSLALGRGSVARPVYDGESAIGRAFAFADRVLGVLTEKAATVVTRRTFLRRLGASGLALWVVSIFPRRSALAYGSCESPCGPSLPCPISRCDNYWECKCGGTYSTERRGPYSSTPNNCMGCSGDNDWWEPWCGDCWSPMRGFWECNDCCSTGLTSAYSTCSSCSVTKRKCICRADYGC